MITVTQATSCKTCAICGRPIKPDHVITLVIPGDAPNYAAHLFCYAHLRKQEQQRQQWRRRQLMQQPS